MQPIQKLFKIIGVDISEYNFNWYQIPNKIYEEYKSIVYDKLREKCHKKVNFGRVKKKNE